MKRWWLGSLLAVPIAFACGDDDDAVDTTKKGDAGSDAPTYAPAEPPVPLPCATVATFDPCDAGLDPSVYGATQTDGGPIANVDAGGYADAGFVPAACVASGAVRIVCDDAGAAHFDLAAGDAGISHVIAFGEHASRFDLGADATMSPLTTFDARGDELRIVSSAAGVAVIQARSGSTEVTALRDGAKTREYASPVGSLNDDPIAGAGMTDDGTIYALLNSGQQNFWRQPIPDPNDTSLHPDIASVPASLLQVRSRTFQLVATYSGGFNPYPTGSTDPAPSVDAPGLANVFAAGVGPKGALVAGRGTSAYDYESLVVFVADAPRDPTFTRLHIEREPPCGLHQTGCGYTCMETRRVPVPGGSFVHLANGNDYFVFGEATVTSERKYAIDYGVACGLLGGCACVSKADVKSIGDVDAVVMQVMTNPDQLVERARAHLVPGQKTGRGLSATARDNQIHVLFQGNANEMARVVIDLGK